MVAILIVATVAAIAGALLVRTVERSDAGGHGASDGIGTASDAPPSVENLLADGRAPHRSPDPPIRPWRIVDKPAAAKPPYPAEWLKAGRVLVDVSTAAAGASEWQVGDSIALQFTRSGAPHQGSIERIDEGPGYSRSARGMAVGPDGISRRFVVTVGPTRMLAYIDTAEGPYELVADTRFGWLVPSSSMLAGFDYSKPDYIVPERWPATEGRAP